jgi:hypothetical protein
MIIILFHKRPERFRLLPVFPSGAVLENRAKRGDPRFKTCRGCKAGLRITKRRHGVAEDANQPSQNQRVLAATRRAAAFDLTLTGSDRSLPEGSNGRPRKTAALIDTDDHHVPDWNFK